MELKTYQKQVIADLNRYLELVGKTKAYHPLLGRGRAHAGIYQNVFPGVPQPLPSRCPPVAGKPILPATLCGPFLRAAPSPDQSRGWCRPMRS